jgi:hypothetical protein
MVDGIYPMYSQFVRTVHEPVTDEETLFAKWQEDARKDVERAFGNLQAKFQVTCRPIMLHELMRFADTFTACLIMHNICVSDRVMEGDVHTRYSPSNILDIPELEEEEIDYPDDFNGVEQGGPQRLCITFLQDHWRALNDILEHARLNEAIMAHVSNR